jgi:hypothetical protein
MNRRTIFKRLEQYLSVYHISLLKINMGVPGSVTMCHSVQTIVHEYNSTQKNEDEVCELLSKLCKIHFSNPWIRPKHRI